MSNQLKGAINEADNGRRACECAYRDADEWRDDNEDEHGADASDDDETAVNAVDASTASTVAKNQQSISSNDALCLSYLQARI